MPRCDPSGTTQSADPRIPHSDKKCWWGPEDWDAFGRRPRPDRHSSLYMHPLLTYVCARARSGSRANCRRGDTRMKRTFRPNGKNSAPKDVEREIELHIDLRAREFEAQGMSREEARRAA